MAAHGKIQTTPRVRPFVKPGEPLGFVARLKERGQWPPRLRHADEGPNADEKTLTALLVAPAIPGDSGARPLPNSAAFHSQAVWLETPAGAAVTAPVVGGQYRIRCRVRNLGAWPAYLGLADFFINTPAAFSAGAGTGSILPQHGFDGFSLNPNEERILSCPRLWQPTTAEELASSIVVHVYDRISDDFNLALRFDARNSRQVARHDLTPDVYVRDWTDSAAVHDRGGEPSTRNLFFVTSDVWNRRTDTPGSFVDDRPQGEAPRLGSAGSDNVMFARVSRNDASTAQTVRAHFLFAEFGTGSPFVNASPAPDPSVTLAPGQFSGIVSMPWHLHPSTSPHLCIAVQVYTDGDPYAPPGLLGRSPGWPTTDLMVITDNNKAQRNIFDWKVASDTEGMVLAVVFNAATFVRDLELRVDASDGTLDRLVNPRISVPLAGLSQDFRPGGRVVLKEMRPGERRWVAFSYDRLTFEDRGPASVYFSESVNGSHVNGFAFTFRPDALEAVLEQTLEFQEQVFFRLAEGLGVGAAREGLAVVRRLQKGRDSRAYIASLKQLAGILGASLRGLSERFAGLRDPFGMAESIGRLHDAHERHLGRTLALHNKLLHQLDALQTMAMKSRGDTADILFTVRLHRQIYESERLRAACDHAELLACTDAFIAACPAQRDDATSYVPFVRSMMDTFARTADLLVGGPVKARYKALVKSVASTPEAVQKAHLDFLNAVLLTLGRR